MIERITPDTKYDFSDTPRNKLEKIMKFLTKKKHAFAVTSGTVGLMLALKTLKKFNPQKNRVLVSNFGHPAAIHCCKFLRFDVHPIEMNKETLSMDPNHLHSEISCNDLAVINVGTNGIVGQIQTIKNICDEKGVDLIEDAAPSFMQMIGDKRAGTFGLMGVYSFSPGKGLYCSEGGCIVTDNDYIAKSIQEFYRTPNFNEIGNSMNFALSNILCNVILDQIPTLYDKIAMRERIHSEYREMGLEIFEDENVTDRYGSIMYLSNKSEEISRELVNNNIGHRYKAYPVYSRIRYFNSCYIRSRLLDLPIGYHVKREDIKYIVNIIKKVENEL